VGALLLQCLEHVRARIEADIKAAGFADVQPAHLAVFSVPPPDGMRPSDLARRIRMSREATNHIIGQLEALGYLERRAEPERRAPPNLPHRPDLGDGQGRPCHAA
jgi:DNA-binding MarR family transcriptional regulator